MITVDIFEDTEGESYNLIIKGHSGQAEEGKDIVCASASILAYALAQSIDDIFDKGGLKNPPTIKLNKGDSVIYCEPTASCMPIVFTAYYYALQGYSLLAEHYPTYVRLSFNRA